MPIQPADENQIRHVIDEPPPVLGTWERVYAVVVAWLFTLILLFYFFSRAFAG